jgi:glycosidase
MNRPEVHDVLRRWRGVADAQDPPRVLVGETYVLDLDSLMPYYGQGEDELHLAFNFLFVHAPLEADALRTIVEGVEHRIPDAAWPVYTGSNHDAGRLTTRWAGDDERRARVALMMLLTLRGTPFLYYGDELALPDVRSIRRRRSTRSRGARAIPRATATSAARRCRGRTRPAAASPPRTRRRGSRSATSPPATSPRSARTRARSCTSCAT